MGSKALEGLLTADKITYFFNYTDQSNEIFHDSLLRQYNRVFIQNMFCQCNAWKKNKAATETNPLRLSFL